METIVPLQKGEVEASVLRHKVLEHDYLETRKLGGEGFLKHFKSLNLGRIAAQNHGTRFMAYTSFLNAVALLDGGYTASELANRMNDSTKAGKDEERFYFEELVPMIHAQRLNQQTSASFTDQIVSADGIMEVR